jgi:TPR repeat protein
MKRTNSRLFTPVAFWTVSLVVGCNSTRILEVERKAGDQAYQNALRYFDGSGVRQSYSEAVRYLREAATHDHVDALLLLAALQRNGTGVDRSVSDAISKLEKASALGSVAATVTLATMYDYGQDVAVDRERALVLYAKASGMGDSYAAITLAKVKAETLAEQKK